MKKEYLIALFTIIIFVITFVTSAQRSNLWAKQIKIEGAPNLHKISNSLYRSAQPNYQGMKNIKKLGIKTVINLRSFHSDRDEIGDIEFKYEHIYMKAWHPEKKEAVKFLQIVTDTNNIPVLVHCLHGADRTGTMSALYRIAIQGWTKEEAIKEMTEGGFGFHSVFDNLIKWINELDIESIKKDAGI